MINTYNKTDISEIINIGDLIMIDPKTNLVTIARADSLEDYIINNTLIVGVCDSSDNLTPLPQMINCKYSVDTERELLYGGDSTSEPQVTLEGGLGNKHPREYIGVKSNGISILNTDHRHIELGDKVIMSIEPNKVTSSMFDDFDRREFYYARPIGKVIKVLPDNKVEVLLDIE